MIRSILYTSLFLSCKAQQKRSISTLPFQNNDRHVNNLCERYHQVKNGTIPLKEALEGLSINVALFRYQLNKEAIDEKRPNMAIRFLDGIAQRAGFTWRRSFGIIEKREGDKTYDPILKWAVNNYDLVGEWFTIKPQRLIDGILFPEGWYDASIIMLRKNIYMENNDSYGMYGMLRPFSVGLWTLIVITIVISGLVYYLVDFLDGITKNQEMSSDVSTSIFNTAYAFTGHSPFKPNSSSKRTVVLSICLLFLLIDNIYTASLTSHVVLSSKPIDPIKNLEEGIQKGYSFCVHRGTTAHNKLLNATNNTAAKIVSNPNSMACYDGVLNGTCEICMSTVSEWKKSEGNSEINKQCQLESVGEIIDHYQAGFSVRNNITECSSLLRDVLTFHMIEMKIDGTYDNIWDSYAKTTTTQNCKAREEVDMVKSLWSIFIFHSIMILLAVALSVTRFCCLPKEKRASICNMLSLSLRRKPSQHKEESQYSVAQSEVSDVAECGSSAKDINERTCESSPLFDQEISITKTTTPQVTRWSTLGDSMMTSDEKKAHLSDKEIEDLAAVREFMGNIHEEMKKMRVDVLDNLAAVLERVKEHSCSSSQGVEQEDRKTD